MLQVHENQYISGTSWLKLTIPTGFYISIKMPANAWNSILAKISNRLKKQNIESDEHCSNSTLFAAFYNKYKFHKIRLKL